ncbi:MAG: polysaccharide pyruvyl transferase family protein [Lachnospiraceae bacterium]|nr:polysaccharide pyruvyl transferase family protein [Lachnospiraceae bacterium]
MKVGIITFHFANNFGAALQTYALSKAIEKITNEDVEIIDYRNPFIRFTDFVRLFPITKNLSEMIDGLKTFSHRIKRKKRFNRFYEEYYKTGKCYNSFNALKNNSPDYDVIVCGSDQIWNPTVTLGVSNAYFINFATQKQKKISYAASLGHENIREKDIKKIKNHLNGFDAISIREEQGIALINKESDYDISHNIDPVFLHDRSFWDKLGGENPIIDGEYILLYVMQNSEETYKRAQKIKELLKIPVVSISRYGYKADCVDRVLVDVGPLEFVNLYKFATFSCTNSFHGLAFSIIFGKKFYLVPSNRFNSRMDNLLKILDIQAKADIDDTAVNKTCYDIDNVMDRIIVEREKSMTYLSKNIVV